MDLDVDYYKTICRVCLSCCKGENMVSLVDNENKDVLNCYGVAVETFADIVIKSDCLPYMMCHKCLLLLKQAIIFKKICENSHKTLMKLVQCVQDSGTQIEETITQFVMFSKYFADVHTKDCLESNKNKKKSNNSKDFCVKSIENAKNVNITVIIERMLDESKNDVNIQDCSSVESSESFHHNQIVENEENNSKRNVLEHQRETDNLLNSIEKMLQLDPIIKNSQLKKYSKNKLKQKSFRQKYRSTVNQKKLHNNIINKMKSKTRDVQCEICNKVLANYQTYKVHKQRHTGKRYVCELCGKSFAVYAFLQSHQAAIHNSGKFFDCNLCDYKAVRKWDLEEHQRVHTGERPYTCEKCGMTFRRQYIWKKHALYHMEKTVQCPKCPCKFHQKGEMRAHYNNIHERMYMYACHECDVTYAKPSTVRRHLFEKHGIEKEKQGKIKRILLGRMPIE